MCLGIPGKIVSIYIENGIKMGKVDYGGVIKEACLEYLPDVQLGEYVIVHVGFGISKVNEKEALATLEMLEEIELGSEEAFGNSS